MDKTEEDEEFSGYKLDISEDMSKGPPIKYHSVGPRDKESGVPMALRSVRSPSYLYVRYVETKLWITTLDFNASLVYI